MLAEWDPYSWTGYDVYVAVLNGLISLGVAVSVIQCADSMFEMVKYVQYKLRTRLTGKEPRDYYNHTPMPDAASMGHTYPLVAVQLPMFNERAVCQAVIDHSCAMRWPRERLLVQVSGMRCACWRSCCNTESMGMWGCWCDVLVWD